MNKWIPFLIGFAQGFSIAALLTHIINCIQNEDLVLLVTGSIAFPVGIIHGFGIWLGVW